MEKYNQRVLTIIIVATVLILVIIFAGVTYAFFTANNPEGSTAQIISENGKMLITYNDGTDNIVPVTNIQPSDEILVNKTFTLTGINTTVGMSSSDGLTMPYKVGVQYTSTFSDGMMHYYIKEVNRPANSNVTTNYVITPEEGKTEDDYINQTIPGNETYTGYTHGTFKNGTKYTEMVTGEFPASLNDQTITFNLIIQFPDNNENQDSEKGKTFNGKVVVNYEPETIAKTLAKLDLTENGLEVDETPDKNLRYVGASPKNYLKFNDETWRIIGVFNNITTIDEQGNEKTESLVKIVRNESLGSYSWDSSKIPANNDWSQSDLMHELNGDYIDISKTTGSTFWYGYSDGISSSISITYDYSKNIKSSSTDKIARVRWNLGGPSYGASTGIQGSALYLYNKEKANEVYGDHKKTWDGKIALIYASDYGYASTSSTCRSSLKAVECKTDNWLFNSENQWTLSPNVNFEDDVIFITGSGNESSYSSSDNYGVRPTLFLKSDVVITGGTGIESDPYTIE